MADNTLQSLADALTNAKQPVVLNAAFITAAGLTPPAGFDDALKAAFRLGAKDAGLQVSFSPQDVGNIGDNSFQVTSAQLPQGFLGAAAADTNVTLTFSLPAAELQVQVEADLANWTFTKFFTFMTGWPFTLLNVESPSFIFSTVKTAYVWNGATVKLTPGQNFAANLAVPSQFQPIFGLVQGLVAVPSTLPVYGPITVDKADNETILYPDMDLVANIGSGSVSIFFLKLNTPFIGFQIETAEDEPEPDEEDALIVRQVVRREGFRENIAIEGRAQKQLDAGGYEDALDATPFAGNLEEAPATEYVQDPSIYFGTKLDIHLADSQTQNGGGNGSSGSTATLVLKIGLIYSGQQSANAPPTQYNLSLESDPDADVILSPGTVASALMNGNSFFQYVPPQLQSFFSAVGFQGLSLNGPLTPTPSISTLSITLGNGAQQSIPLISDPTNGQIFTIETIALTWTIINPLGASATRQNLVNFSTSFIIFPKVFRQANGDEGGLFAVSIDQDFNIDGSFNGSVSLDDLLREVTKGAIGMPSGVEVSFSDVTLSISPAAKSYSFAFTFDGELNFIKWGDQPLIQFQHMRFMFAAVTPSSSGNGGDGANAAATGTTVYRGSIEGVIGIGPIMVNASVAYDGTTPPKVWTLHTSLAEPLSLSDLLTQFFRAFNLPNFLPGNLTVQSFSVDATIPVQSQKSAQPAIAHPESLMLAADAAGNGEGSKYRVAGTIEWDSGDTLPEFPIKTTAQIGLQYDGSKAEGQKFSGSVIGTLTLDAINTEVMVGYNFGTAQQDALALARTLNQPALAALSATALTGDSQTLWVQWNGLRATYDITNKTLTFTLTGWTVGSLLQELVRMVGDPYFTLDSPWDLLNKISLDNLQLVFDFKPGVKSRVSAKYNLPSPIDLGFMKINALVFQRVAGKVTIAIDGKITVPGLQESPLFNPAGEGQDVKNMPSVPGRGNSLFDLRLLAFGQRVGIRGHDSFNSVEQVINALSGIKPTTGKENPVNPTDPTAGQPYYSEKNNWLVAANFGLIRAGKVYTFECMFVFNDPDLYGLRLAFNGDKAKVLAGLVIEILYKKITDDIGLYQIDFSFPSILRNIDFGAFSIVLPNLGIQIYTNGDFLFDFGFPYNLDFSRSFSVQAIILGVPVLGSAGFYFGKLSSATTNKVPQTTCGTFNPVIVFGLGVQVGVGRYFEKGPLKAGFSITVFGIIEGVIAAWHPYPGPPAGCQPIPTSGAVEDNYYFWLQGTFGVIGKLYGTIDFVIIKADVSLLVQVVAQVTFESFRAIPLSISAHVSIKVSIKIDLGLFSISISFSFAATISANLTIGSDSIAPWDGQALPQTLARRRRIAPTPRFMLAAAAEDVTLRFKPIVRGAGVVSPALLLVPGPQFTVHTPDVNSTNPADQRGAFVFLLAMDAPTADGTGGNNNGSSFESLCAALLPWVIDSFVNQTGDAANLASLADTSVTKEQLADTMKKLADTTTIPIPEAAILKFLQSGFTVNVVTPDVQYKEKLQAGATIFPAFSGFSLTFPNPDGQAGQTLTVDLGQYVTITDNYRVQMAKLFRKLAARVQEESGTQPPLMAAALDETDEPLARFILEDYFLLVARQLVQSAEDSLDDFAYPLEPKPAASGGKGSPGAESPLGAATPPPGSLASILKWAHDRNNPVIFDDIAEPNLTHQLTGGNALLLNGLQYTVQQKDTLQSIAARYSDSAAAPRWQTTPASLIVANATLNTLILPNVTINVAGKPPYVTQPGDSFGSIAASIGVTLSQLSGVQSLYATDGLLAPSLIIAVPDIAYATAADNTDTLQSVLSKFTMPLADFLSVEQNQNAPYFFDTGKSATIRIANLSALFVSDLWAAIRHDGKVAQTAGMVGRYQLHGMRLPNQAATPGLKLPANFLYPAGQPDYGLFQLTGQQFPTPAFTANPTYGLTLSKNSALAWLQFNGATATNTLSIDLSKQAAQLGYVLQYALNPGYDPSPSLDVQPDVNVRPKRYAVRSATLWSTSDQAHLAALTAPAARLALAVSAANEQPQAQPILWEMPESLLREAEKRQAIVSANTNLNIKESQPFLAVFAPEVGTTDPATRSTTFNAVNDYAFATRIDFQIKRLAQASDQAPQTPFANDVVPPDDNNNHGSPAVPLAPFSYELLGPGPNDAILLQRLLTAMDASGGLGEGIISGLFILYPDNAAAPNGLVSRADSEFLSFITQTNLSTETNPPQSFAALLDAEVAAPPRGIANRPADFVKLMWELSTVRSGGYYLYYEVVGQGIGLPDSLFDESGAATLTLVITYNRADEPANGGRLTDYANAFVSTDSIDRNRSVMTLLSESAPAQTQALKGTERLQDISNIYGADVGVLAALNPAAAFVNGKQVPITGVVRRVTPADIQAGNVLDNFAAYYSKGATQPLKASDIAAFNPGVPVALYSVFRIPPIIYVVSAAQNAPGNTYASLSRYYDLTSDALADLTRNVAGLFAAGTQLATDSQTHDVQPALGTGNVGVELTRANPGAPPDLPANPTPAEQQDFARKYLFSLYTLLTAGLYGNAFFDASQPGLSFGPRKSLTPEDAAALRHPQTRQMLLAAQDAEPFDYSQAVGFGSFSRYNAAPVPDPLKPGLPPQSANPYIGVGTLAQLNLRWLDIFGNRTVTPFEAPSATTAALNNPPAVIDYVDRLIGLDRWPNVRSYYTYGGTTTNPQVVLTLQLMSAAYDAPTGADDPRNRISATGLPAWQQNAANDLKTFTQLYFQLNQDYDNLGIPGLSGRAVSMLLSNTILAAPDAPLSDADSKAVRNFVADCLVYVYNRSQAKPGGTQPALTLNVAVPLGAVSTENIVQLTLGLTLARQPALSDPALRGMSDGLAVTSAIRPLMDDDNPAARPAADGAQATAATPPPPQTMKRFANDLEGVFNQPDWQFRVGTGAGTPGQPRGQRSFTVWAVRMGKTQGSGLWYQFGSQAGFYAPKPVARTMHTGTVKLDQYQTGEKYPTGDQVEVTFTGVDLNTWANTALSAIDTFLAPSFAGPAFIVDSLFSADPSKDGYLAKILQHKQTLADAIASTVKPILVTSATDQDSLGAAEEKLRQSLLNRLSNAYVVTAIAVIPVTGAGTNEPPEPGTVAQPRFFGQPLGELVSGGLEASAANDSERNYSLSTGKISLPPQHVAPSNLAFLFSSKNVKLQPYVQLQLSYALTHLEHDIANVPGIRNYEQSAWIHFVNGPFVTPIGASTGEGAGVQPTNFPIVLRALPTPPTVVAQTGLPAIEQELDCDNSPAGITPDQLADWDYSFSYNYQNSAQDSVNATVEFNLTDTHALLASDGDILFAPLAQFITINPAIANDFEAFLRKVNSGSKATDQPVINAKEALAAFENIVGKVAAAYRDWATPPLTALGDSGELPRLNYTFDIVLIDDNGDARVDVDDVVVKQIGSNTTVPNLTLPIVKIKPDTYQWEPEKPPAKPPVSYKYKLITPPDGGEPDGDGYLPYDEALATSGRIVSINTLNVFSLQNAWAAVAVTRNQFLVPNVATTDTFKFSTPEVKFAAPLVPLLDYAGFNLDASAQAPAKLETYLGNFFTALFSAATGLSLTVKIAASFSYSLVPSITSLSRTSLPVSLLPPTDVTPQAGQAPAFVAPFAAAITNWLVGNAPALNESSQLNFKLDIFAGGSSSQALQMPLLTIRNLCLDANQVKLKD